MIYPKSYVYDQLGNKPRGNLYYLKYEVDKVIAAKDKEISELKEHPTTGTGHPEQLKGDKVGKWSWHITGKHRLIYEIREEVVIVNVLSAYGHYGDK